MMTVNRIFFVFFVTGCILMMQIGCESQAASAKKSTTAATKVENAAKANESQADVNGASVISFEKTVCNLGEVSPGSQNLWEFKFKNTGKGVLKITEVKKTCGCTPFTLEKMEYNPGESGILKGKYHASMRKGSVSKHVYVFSNDKNKPKVGLTIIGKIAPKVEYKPENIELSLGLENAGCPQIVLNSTDGKEFAIKNFSSTNQNCITADFDPNEKATKLVLQPKVDPNKVRGKMRGKIKIELTHPKCNSVSIPYKALAEYVISPKSIIVRNAEPNEPIKKLIVVDNSYKKQFNIESTSSRNGYVKVLSQEKRTNHYRFQLEVTPPPLTARGLYFRDVLSVKIEGGPKLDVAIVGYYAKNARK